MGMALVVTVGWIVERLGVIWLASFGFQCIHSLCLEWRQMGRQGRSGGEEEGSSLAALAACSLPGMPWTCVMCVCASSYYACRQWLCACPCLCACGLTCQACTDAPSSPPSKSSSPLRKGEEGRRRTFAPVALSFSRHSVRQLVAPALHTECISRKEAQNSAQ